MIINQVAYGGQAQQGAGKLAVQATIGHHITRVAVLQVQRQILTLRLWEKIKKTATVPLHNSSFN